MFGALIYGASFCAVEHGVDQEGQDVFNLLILQKEKSELSIKKKQTFNEFDNLLKELEGQKHLFLIVNNNQVLTKSSNLVDVDVVRHLQNSFPTITQIDFYCEVLKAESQTFISIARKTIVDTIIETYQQKGISIIGFSLGNLGVKNILPYLTEETIYTTNAKVVNNSNQIESIESSFDKKEEYEVNNLNVTSQFLLPLSGVIQYYTNVIFSEGLGDEISKLKKDFEQKTKLKTVLYIALGLLLLTTLTNFLVYNNYKSKVLELDTTINIVKTRQNSLLKLQSKVQQKERLLNSVRLVSNSKVSKYIDEIGVLIPNTVLLSELSYQPIQQRLKKDKEINFKKNSIVVKGVVKKDEDFTNLVNNLEQNKWVDELTIVSYGKNKGVVNQFEFLITIVNE